MTTRASHPGAVSDRCAAASSTLGPDWLRARLAGLLDPPDAESGASEPPAPTAGRAGTGTAPSRAAVLVPVVLSDPPEILLTKRSDRLRHHAGQVSFPGGRFDPSDRDAVDAALREAEEEIGLDPAACAVVGLLPPRLTGTGFSITPVVALVRPDAAWRASPAEVDEILFLPLSDLLDPAAATRERSLFRGEWHDYWVWRHPKHLVWGATAHILMSLAERLREAVGPDRPEL